MSDDINYFTDEMEDDVLNVLDDNLKNNENLSYVADLPSNNGVEERTDVPEKGFEQTVSMRIDPVTGAALPTNEEETKNSLDISFEDLMNDIESSESEPITEDDIIKGIEKDDDVFKDLDITRDDAITLLSVVQRMENGEDFNIYKALPESVRNTIDDYMNNAGVGKSYAPEINNLRNDITSALMGEFVANLGIEKAREKYTEEMDKIQEEINKDLCDICMEYEKDRNRYIENLIANTDDPEKKKIVEDLLDAINDGFHIKRIKESCKVKPIVIKKFETEKPEKVFSAFLHKYNKPTPSIYSIFDATNVLKRHMKDTFTEKEIVAYMIAFCKYTQNYKAEVPLEHAFMYYFIYNIMVMDIYKGEEYEKFTGAYKESMRELLDMIYVK